MSIRYLNEGYLMGNLTKQPELYASNSAKGTEFTYINLAVQRKQYDKKIPPTTDFFPLIAFSWNAKELVEQAKKGTKLFVKYHSTMYPKKTDDGKTENIIQFVVDVFTILENRVVGKPIGTDDSYIASNSGSEIASPDDFDADDTALPFDL